MYVFIGCPAARDEHNDLISLLTTVSAPLATVAASHAAANWATASASASGRMTVLSVSPSSFAEILILGRGHVAPQHPLTAWEPLAASDGVASWRSMRMRALACSLLSFSAKTLLASKSSSKRKLTSASVLVSSLVFCKRNVSCLAPRQEQAQRRSEVPCTHQQHGQGRAGSKLTFFVAAGKHDFIAAERGSLACRPI